MITKKITSDTSYEIYKDETYGSGTITREVRLFGIRLFKLVNEFKNEPIKEVKETKTGFVQ